MTDKKREANKRNAQKSTGPKTPQGKATVSKNALKHGLRSFSLAVPIMESPEDWEAHRKALLHDLQPVGYMEGILADRLAGILWRLNRVVRYESLQITSTMEAASENYKEDADLWRTENPLEKARKDYQETADLVGLLDIAKTGKASQKVPPLKAWELVEIASDALDVELEDKEQETEDAAFYNIDLPEVPEEVWVGSWDGWTVGFLRTVLSRVGKLAGVDLEDTYNKTLDLLAGALEPKRKDLQKEEGELERFRRKWLIPGDATLDKVSRYETALERSFYKNLHELQRLQAKRTGEAVPAPSVMDIGMDVGFSMTDPS